MIECKTYIEYKCPNCEHKCHRRLYSGLTLNCSKCGFPVASIQHPIESLVYNLKLLGNWTRKWKLN